MNLTFSQIQSLLLHVTYIMIHDCYETEAERLFRHHAHLAFVFRHTTNHYGLKL